MYKVDKIELKEDIRLIKMDNLEEFLLISKNAILNYIYSGITFLFSSDISNDCLNIIYEFRKIIKKENKLLNKLYDNSDNIDLDEIDKFIEELNDLNEKSFNYYSKQLESIHDACQLKQEYRGRRRGKIFDLITDNDYFDKLLVEINLNMNDIKDFFGFDDEFYNFINSKMIVLDSREEDKEEFSLYGVNIKTNDDGTVKDFKIIVPEIINLKTALINIHELKHAHDLYEDNKLYDEQYYEERAVNCEEEFKNYYLVKKLDNSTK